MEKQPVEAAVNEMVSAYKDEQLKVDTALAEYERVMNNTIKLQYINVGALIFVIVLSVINILVMMG